MAFNGWMIKFGGVELPIDCLVTSSYQCVVERTVHAKYKDMDNGNHWEVDPRPKAKVTVSTEDYLEYPKMQKILEAFKAGLINETEQRYQVSFWNVETGAYTSTEMHMSDIEYTILDIWDSGPVYEAFEIELEEY